MTELLLDIESWDLKVSEGGDISVADEAYGVAQAVANEVKLFRGEGWFDVTQGVPHFTSLLGVTSSLEGVSAILESAARRVDGVEGCRIALSLDTSRNLRGTIAVSTGGRVVTLG